MINEKPERRIGYLFLAVLLVILVYAVLKAYNQGNDIDIYLRASRQLFNHEKLYVTHSVYNYFYSPFFAMIMRPLSIFSDEIGRVLWALINLLVTIRVFSLLKKILKDFELDENVLIIWGILVLLVSLGFLNHNLILGQISIIIFWLTFEGLYQVLIAKNRIVGSSLIALGINIKIFPLFALFYLFIKKKYKALFYSLFFLGMYLLIPALVLGFNKNIELHTDWMLRINPNNGNFVFENDSGCHSLNSFLPAYLYDYGAQEKVTVYGLTRKIANMPYDMVLFILQATRLVLLLSFIYLIAKKDHIQSLYNLDFLQEVAYLLLISFLIFPHQLKYSMVYFIPAGAYILLFIVLSFSNRRLLNIKLKAVLGLSIILLFILAIMGRDIIGDDIVNILDYYHFISIVCLLFLVFLQVIQPKIIYK